MPPVDVEVNAAFVIVQTTGNSKTVCDMYASAGTYFVTIIPDPFLDFGSRKGDPDGRHAGSSVSAIDLRKA